MAEFRIPNQNLSFFIPDDGEVVKFDAGASGTGFAVRIGNKLYTTDLQDLGNQLAREQGVNITSGAQAQQLASSYLQQQGFDINSAKTVNQSEFGDLLSVFDRGMLGADSGRTQLGISNIDVLKSTPQKTGEVFTQGVSETNPNAPTLESSFQGSIDTGAPTYSTVPNGTNTSAQVNVSSIANLPNLEPGSRGDDVKRLQTFLIGQGYSIPDGATGYFGDQTKAALASWQQANGIDTAGNPGYFGPRSKAFLSSTGSGLPAPDSGNTGTANGTDMGTLPNQSTEEDKTFEQILAGANLTQDQKDLITNVYNTISTNDQENARRLGSAITAAMEYSDPYFKAQARIVIDSIQRGFVSADQDQAFKEAQLTNTLNDLKADIATSKDTLTFNQQQDLKNLERSYTQNLDDTRQSLAATGFTSSSVRSRKEQLLSDTYGDLRNSSIRGYNENINQLNTQQTRAERDIAAEVSRLNELTKSGKIDLLRKGEETLGSTGLGDLPTLSGYQPLGGIVGTLPQAQASDALSFANNLIF